VNTPPDHEANQPPSSIRMDARLDPMTRQNVDDLAKHFHQPRAAVLSHIMHWGLNCEQTGPLDQGDAQGAVRHLYLYVESELYERVEKATMAVGMKIAPWLRQMVRQITISEFPPAGRRLDQESAPMIPTPMACASCCGWMHPHRLSFSNSPNSLAPQKPRLSASSSPRRTLKMFRRAGTRGLQNAALNRPYSKGQATIRSPRRDAVPWN
jgi:hypothetical protein